MINTRVSSEQHRRSQQILMISMTPSHPQDAGNRMRIYSLAMNLRELGHSVSFLFLKSAQGGDDEAMQRYWGDNYYSLAHTRRHRSRHVWARRFYGLFGSSRRYLYSVDELYDSALDRFLDDMGAVERFDTVIVEYVFQSRALENFDHRTLKIIDTHDVFTNRHDIYLNCAEKPDWLSISADDEARALNRADSVIATQDNERNFFASLVDKQIVTVGHTVPIYESDWTGVVADRLLFVASNSRANRHALELMLHEILPRVRKSVANIELALAGDLCLHVEDMPNLTKLGYLTDLRQAYMNSALVVNPIMIGTGLKIKTIEALGHGKPLVTTKVGAEGLEDGWDKAFIVADEATSFAAAIVELLQDRELADDFAHSATQYASLQNRQTLASLQSILS